MGWSKVLIGGAVTHIDDLFTGASLPASGSVSGITVDSSGDLGVGDIGSTLQLKDDGGDVGTGSDSIDFLNFFTIADTAGAGTVTIDTAVGALDGDEIKIGTPSTGLHDWANSTAVSAALIDLDDFCNLLAPDLPPLLSQGHTINVTVQGQSASVLLLNQDGAETTSAMVVDTDEAFDLDWELTGGTGNLGGNSTNGAFGKVTKSTSFYKVEMYDASAGAWDPWHEWTAAADDVTVTGSAITEGYSGDTISYSQQDYHSEAAQGGAEGFWDVIYDLRGTIFTSGTSGPEVGYHTNQMKISEWADDSEAVLIGTELSSQFPIIKDKWKETGFATSFWVRADGSGPTSGIASWVEDNDGSGDSCLGNSFYIASGMFRLRAGDKLPFTVNTGHYGWMEDVAGDYWVNQSNSKRLAVISKVGRGEEHSAYWTDYYMDGGGGGASWTGGNTVFMVGGNPEDVGLANGMWWEVSTSDMNDTHDTFYGSDAFDEMEDFHMYMQHNQDTAIPNGGDGANLVTDPPAGSIDGSKVVPIIAKTSPFNEGTYRVKTMLGQYPTVAIPQAYDPEASIVAGDYADSLMYNGHQFYHPWDTAGKIDYSSAHLDYLNDFIGFDYSGINGESSSSYRYMQEAHTIMSVATSQLKVTLTDKQWSVDGEGNDSNVRILIKIVDTSGTDMTNWFDACSNFGATPPDPGDANGSACHMASSADNVYGTAGNDLVKICDLGMFLNDSSSNIHVYVRVGLKHSVSQNTYNFTTALAEANV